MQRRPAQLDGEGWEGGVRGWEGVRKQKGLAYSLGFCLATRCVLRYIFSQKISYISSALSPLLSSHPHDPTPHVLYSDTYKYPIHL